ncbi:P1 family peptidase [Peptoniphilus sp. oral taxon 386]|uniref:P1 family peptidase n=1 Tax=Peptoniphilus sp. oral taxon 386 TaxID=652713 RepID=UPI0001DAA0E0|nr:P1 family peptidase [Peptoniphilus sp. oral taxon 386]EFI41671.1 peptidase family T4 [Peptoniphilus sp. oral taxon 386 str. F0131]
MYSGYLTDVGNLKVGHAQNFDGLTGVTVIIPEKGAVCGVDVRGSAPGTRETDLLRPENLVEKVNCVMLSGGSAYGLNAASGIMKYLEEKELGMDVTVCRVPIVVGAVIFDLAVGDPHCRPDLEMGYEACKNSKTEDTSMGCIGAGTGATVGKILGNDFSMKSGIGQASIQIGNLKIAALTVLNAFGDICDAEKGIQIAGVYSREEKKFLDTMKIYEEKTANYNAFNRATNTTISIVATNAKLTKANCNKISQMAHDGYARSIEPVHTMFDGDTIFTIATGEVETDISFVGMTAAKVISRAISNAVYSSKTTKGLISYEDINL